MTTIHLRKSIGWSPLARGLPFIPLLLACYGLSSTLQAGSNTNTSLGLDSLPGNTNGTLNTGLGYQALKGNTVGSSNTATGARALATNNGGNNNTATGWQALEFNLVGSSNTALGGSALRFNTGLENTATGHDALLDNGTGNRNTATGDSALKINSTGSHNTAIGGYALAGNQAGDNNTASGYLALSNNMGSNNTALGTNAGNNVIAANNVICIGTAGDNVSNSCFIGNIRGVTTQNANAIPVLIDSAGQLGTMSSSRRFKDKLKPMDRTSECIMALKPVTFQYKNDKTGTPQFGLIAEEVAEVNPNLVVRDENGGIYTVRYDAVNAMLLNEFLKEHRKVQEQQATIAELKATVSQQQKESQSIATEQQKEIKALAANLKMQASQIQKVSAALATASPSDGGLEVSEPAPRTVVDNK